MSRRENTVIGNLREVAERLAPGRACISVVSDHGIAKTGAPANLFPEAGLKISLAGHAKFLTRRGDL